MIMKEADALLFVKERHGDTQYDKYPYYFHLYQVVSVAKEFGYGNDEDIVIACWLHDALEDTATSYNDIKNRFNRWIAEIVYCVTDELGRNRHERHERTYPKIVGHESAIIVKLCDRIANVRFSIASGNGGMYDMYKKEHDDFKKNLYIKGNETDQLWNELDRLFNKRP